MNVELVKIKVQKYHVLTMALKRKHSDEGWEDEAAAHANTSQLF